MRNFKLSFNKMLLLLSLIPLLVAIILSSVVLIAAGSKEIKTVTNNEMMSVINEIGTAFDYSTACNEVVLKDFITSPIIR